MSQSRSQASTAGRVLLAGLLLSLAVGGCAYFNLFYNAEDAFEEGERIGREVDPRDRPTNQQRTQYNRAIQKCRMLLDEYPDSGLVDDALFLMGKSYFRMREWSEAVRNLDAMLVNFPSSDRAEEATYLLSIAYLSRGDEDLGLQWFAQLKESYPEGRYAAEALYQLGDAWAQAGRRQRAIESYEEFLADFGDRPEAARARVALARIQLEDGNGGAKNAEAALAALEEFEVDRIESPREANELQYEAETLRAEALIRLERYEEALVAVDLVDASAETDTNRRKAVLLRGRILLLTGQVEEGREVLGELIRSESLQPEATTARKISIEYFASREGPESELLREEIEAASTAGRMAGSDAAAVRDYVSRLGLYDKLRASYDAGDSNSAAAAFALGEIVLTDYDRPTEAYVWYQTSLELDPDGPYVPRALYALGWLSSERLDDPDGGAQWFATLQTCCPETPQARALRGEEFVEAKPRTREELERLAGLGGPGAGAGPDGVDLSDPRKVPWRSLRRGGPGAMTPREAGL